MTYVAFFICLAGCILIARTLPWFVARPFLHIPVDAELDRKLSLGRNFTIVGAGLGLVLLAYVLLLATGGYRDNTPLDYLALDITIAGSLYLSWGFYFSITNALGRRLNDRLDAPHDDPDPWKSGYAYQWAVSHTLTAVLVSGMIILLVGLLLQAAS